MVHLDFLPGPTIHSMRSIHFGHARRNNEPFMEPLARMDLPALLERLGFRNVEIRPVRGGRGHARRRLSILALSVGIDFR